MTSQPYAPQIASKSTLATKAVRAHVAIALRSLADTGTTVTHPDGGGPITVTVNGRIIQVVTQDITGQQ